MLNGSFVHIDDWSGWLILTNNQFDEFNNIASQGDSGSALFVYDNQKKSGLSLELSGGFIITPMAKTTQHTVNGTRQPLTT